VDFFSLIGAVLNGSAYQHPRRNRYTVAGEKNGYEIFVFKSCSKVLLKSKSKNNI